MEIINFGSGQPDFPTPTHLKKAGQEAIDANFTRYPPQNGFQDLREAIARKFHVENNISVLPEQVVVSCGAKHSLYNVLQCLVCPGDEVILFVPYWFSYIRQVEYAGGKAVLVNTSEDNGFIPLVEDIRLAVTDSTKAVIINSPCNPTGAVYEKGLLREIAQLAVEHGLYIISDEVYEKILFDGAEHISIASVDSEASGRTITVNSISKTHSMTGWRIGYAAMPLDLAEKVTALQSFSTSGPCAISQRAALAALTTDQAHVRTMVAEYAKRRDFLLRRFELIPHLSYIPPKGTFYLFINISEWIGKTVCGKVIRDSTDFVSLLFDKAAVKVGSGKDFGSASHIRVSFAISIKELEEAMDRIERLLNG